MNKDRIDIYKALSEHTENYSQVIHTALMNYVNSQPREQRNIVAIVAALLEIAFVLAKVSGEDPQKKTAEAMYCLADKLATMSSSESKDKSGQTR